MAEFIYVKHGYQLIKHKSKIIKLLQNCKLLIIYNYFMLQK